MDFGEFEKLEGVIEFKVYDSNGNLKDYRIVHNTITNVGKAQVAALVGGLTSTPFTYIGIGDTSLPTWAASTSYSIGDRVVPSSSNGYYYECTVAGTSGSSEPSWPTTVGATVTDGGVTWVCKGSVSAAATDTTLMHELKRKQASASQVTTSVSNDTLQLVATFNSSDGLSGSAAITESGIFDASSGGHMLNRATFDPINLNWDNGDSITMTWKVQFQ